MKGSSKTPKSDINSITIPTTTANNNAELQTSAEPYKRKKTRKPSSVRAKERAAALQGKAKTNVGLHEVGNRSASSLLQNIRHHTESVVSVQIKKSQAKTATQSKANNLEEIAVSLMLRIHPALVEKELDQLEIVLKGLEENNLRFDRPPLFNHGEIKKFILTGTIRVIMFNENAISDKAEDLLIRMIRLGCNANVTGILGNSVLMLE